MALLPSKVVNIDYNLSLRVVYEGLLLSASNFPERWRDDGTAQRHGHFAPPRQRMTAARSGDSAARDASGPTGPLPLWHRLWRLLPARSRRQALARGMTVFAPRLPPPPLATPGGVLIGGEISRASGLGAGARIMLAALERLGVPAWQYDMAAPPEPGREPLATGAALVLHVNAPLLPLALRKLRAAMPDRRRVIGFWAWELETAPPEWR